MQKKIICVRCPEGCEITTTLDGYGNITEITGNSCKLGIEHVNAEVKDPRRTLTTTVMVKDGALPLCPVWSEQPVPKDKVLEIAAELRKITLKAPVNINQIVLENALGNGINIVASRTIREGANNG
jgi:CxxC motif-containing protein